MATTPLRWYILFVYGWIGTQFMINWFIFGSITTQTQEYYQLPTPVSGSVNHQIATILSLGPFVFFCVAPFAVYILRYPVYGFQISMRLAASSAFTGMLFISIPSILSSHTLQSIFKYEYHIDGSFWNTLIFLYTGAVINCFASPLFLGSPAKLSVMWFDKHERNLITGVGATIGNLGQCFAYFIPPLLVHSSHQVPHLLFTVLGTSFTLCCLVFLYFPAHPKVFPTLASKISTMSSSHLLHKTTDTGNKNSHTIGAKSKQIQTVHKSYVQMDVQDDISTDSSCSIDDNNDILNIDNMNENNGNKSNYETLPFKHTTTDLFSNISNGNANGSQPKLTTGGSATSNGNDVMNHSNISDDTRSSGSYTALPFAHTGTNLFASGVQLNKKNFQEHMRFIYKDFKYLFDTKRDKSCLLLLIAGGINVGVTSGWCSILQDMLKPIGISQRLIGYIGACLMFAQIIGALIGGFVVDRKYSGQLKKCIIVFQLMDVIWYSMAFLLVPNCFLENNDTFIYIDNYELRFIALFTVCFFIGLNFGLSTPIYFELLAEISFPVAETSSTNGIMCIAVPIMMMIMEIGSINTAYDTPIALMLVTIAFILDLFVVETYRRTIL
eukprot:214875_1